MSCDVTVRVINGRDNTSSLVFGLNDAGVISTYDWTGVTRFTLEFDNDGTPVVVDTDVNPTAIQAMPDGELLFTLGGLSLPVGTFAASLFIYSATYPSGFLLDNGRGYTFALEVV